MSRIKTNVTYEDLLPYLEYLTFIYYGDEYDLCNMTSDNTLFEYFTSCEDCPFCNNDENCLLYSGFNPSLHLVIKQLQQLHPELFI